MAQAKIYQRLLEQAHITRKTCYLLCYLNNCTYQEADPISMAIKTWSLKFRKAEIHTLYRIFYCLSIDV